MARVSQLRHHHPSWKQESKTEPSRRIAPFAQEAAYRLPGCLYSFNIADFKRRNSHLGHLEGDKDIEELDRLLRTGGPGAALVERTHGNRWLMLRSREETNLVQTLLNSYKRTQPLVVGWRVFGTKDGKEKVLEKSIDAEISQAVRCLYTHAATPAELATAFNGSKIPTTVCRSIGRWRSQKRG